MKLHTTRSRALRFAAISTISAIALSGLAATSAAADSGYDPIPVEPGQRESFPDLIPPDVQREPVEVYIAGTPSSVTIDVDDSGVVRGTVTDSNADPVAGVSVAVVATSDEGRTFSGQADTDAFGDYRVQLELPSGEFSVVATADDVQSAQATVIRSTQLNVKATIPATVSERSATLSVTVKDRGVLSKAKISLYGQDVTQNRRELIGTTTASAGAAAFSVRPWMRPIYTAEATRKGVTSAVSVTADTQPRFAVARVPKNSPQPETPNPIVGSPVGSGAKSVSRAIPGKVWKSMKGISWSKGCVKRSRLRLIEVNYRGYDGYRHRGQIVVARSIGSKAAKAFKRLYKKGFPIRSMQLVDGFGKNRGGRPGANDYKSMEAGNTSGFNCRYVVGRESQRIRSPHSSGRSLDINTWVNPYVSPRATYPNTYYLNRGLQAEGMWQGSSAAMSVMRKAGCRWGGSYRDYHHFDC